MSDDKKQELTREDIEKILKIIAKVYEDHGKTIETATLTDGESDEGELLIDNRKEKDIN